MRNIFDIDKYKELWQTISRNKTHSILTGFGVAWGVFMFIIMSGVGNGFQKGIFQGIDNIPKNSIFFFTNTTSLEYNGFNANRKWNIKNEDINVLKKSISEIQNISGVTYGNNSETTYKDITLSYNTRGVDNNYIKIEPYKILMGRNIDPIDIAEKRKVCIIGKKAYSQLFSTGEDPVGKFISINHSYFQVIGVALGSENINIGGNINSSIIMPVSTIQQLYNLGSCIHMLAIAAYDDVDIKSVENKVSEILKSSNNISPNDKEALMNFNLSELLKTFQNLFTGIKLLIWIVGMGTLLAGAVGISNIMLVSIKERTNEIGIRRAIGAKPNTIMKQILGESTLLTFISGYLGMFLGILSLEIVNKVIVSNPNNNMFTDPQISFSLSVTALIIIVIAGLLAGIIPAKRALNIKAIDALRDE